MAKGVGSWETEEASIQNAKVGVAIPHVGLVFTSWAIRLRTLIFPPNTDILHAGMMPIQYARNQLVYQAQKANCDYIFFLDSDTEPPNDALIRLMKLNLPIVTGVYRNKQDTMPAVWRKAFDDGRPGYIAMTDIIGRETPLLEVDVAGMGCCLIKMDVFKKIEYPWFDWTVNMDRTAGLGEDFYFCDKAAKAGIKTVVDTRILCDHNVLATLPGNFGPMRKTTI